MRKLRKAAVVVAMVSSVGLVGAGSAFAGDAPKHHHKKGKAGVEQEIEQDVSQVNYCWAKPVNININLSHATAWWNAPKQIVDNSTEVECTNVVAAANVND